ncbi:amidohydrolase [Alkalihalobacillus macyae]|uniref:M20 metallopeptidase family protein n=1 Tax=Guptibacillus hwajinpoensis TaxID=208199 RepID=UPI00273CC23A|nr:amidohydrolase [Alkalihalobacillus macyae]MDP4552899.1 amidohydrolase [Alkalihalobacillus macyae]
MDIKQVLDNLFDEMVTVRRHLHMNPELSFEEVETPKFIADYHRKLGHEVREHVGGRGVVAILNGAKSGKTVGLRADFDALPIHEENDVDYKSKVEGVMHACGHDGHTATLLGVAKALNGMRESLEGRVVFIHQHAEEMQPGGAIAMIEDGCLEGVDVIYGTHLWATEQLGEILYKEGPLTAAADRFEVVIQGKGGHGAQPHLTKDSIVIASQVVLNLQQLVSRRTDPLDQAVVSIGSFEAINAFNVIADKVVLKGTVRTFKKEVQQMIESEIDRVINGTCFAANADYTLNYIHGYPATVNHSKPTIQLARVAKEVTEATTIREYKEQMGGEDFSYFLEHVPGTYFFTGAMVEDQANAYPHHHPKFNFDERAMLIASKTLALLTLDYLEPAKTIEVEEAKQV